MKIYSLEEVLADIKSVEGFEVKLAKDPSSFKDRVWYTQLYSERHPEPMSDNATVNDVTARVNAYMTNVDLMLPAFDHSPVDLALEYKYLVYRLIGAKGLPIHELRIEFLKGALDAETFKEMSPKLLSSDSEETALCVIFVDEKETSMVWRGHH